MASKHPSILRTPVEKLLSLPFWRWGCLIPIFFSNAWLSYSSSPFPIKATVLLATWILPLCLMIFLSLRMKLSTSEFLVSESLPAVSSLWLWVFLAPAVAMRLWKLTTLFAWPVKDEGIFGYFAVRLTEKWNGSLIQGLNQLPTLFTWFQALEFKLLGVSLGTLWLFPALWSLLLLPLTWWACRQFFSRGLSFWILMAAAYGFWPLFLGRFSTQAIFMVDWEILSFFYLGFYLRSEPTRKLWALGLLILVVGVGFYTYLPWPLVAFMIGLALWDVKKSVLNGLVRPIAFYVAVGLLAIPLLVSMFGHRLHYLGHLWSVGQHHRFGDYAWLLGAYLTDLFWGKQGATFHYGPIGEGFLNPLSGALFLLGFTTLFRLRPAVFSLWCMAAFALFGLPAVLSNDFEDMRVVQWIPLVAILIGLGLKDLSEGFAKGRRNWVLAGLLLFSASLDAYHLFVNYPRYTFSNPEYYAHHRSPEFYQAYEILRRADASSGPGLILLKFDPDPFDQTLFVATYGFNGAENPSLDPATEKWAAILVNIHELPYLRWQFPNGKWAWLSNGFHRMDGGLLLGILPVTGQTKDKLERWMEADQSLSELVYKVMERGVDQDQSQMLSLMDKAYPLFKGDRLLESRYWRIRAVHETAAGHWDLAIEDERKAITQGNPMAHLYNELGCLLFKENRLAESNKAFKEALRLSPNFTDAALNLQNLSLLKNGN